MLPLLLTTFLASAAACSAPPAPPAAPRERLVAILVYEGVELLDFAGPGEVFSAVHGPDGHAFRVVTLAEEKTPVLSQGFVRVEPTYSFADCPPLDVLVLPGGHVPDDDPEVVAFVRARARTSECVLSVCNGAFLLARAGLLDGREATTHHGSLEALALGYPSIRVLTNRRFVDHGAVMTCAGVSAGIDGALQLVTRLSGVEAARAAARYMEYDWRPEELARLHQQPGLPVGENPLRKVARAALEQGSAAGRAALAALGARPGEEELCAAAGLLAETDHADEARALLALGSELDASATRMLDQLAELCESAGLADEAVAHARALLARLPGTREPAEAALLRNAAASRLVRLGQGDARTLRFGCEPCGGGACDERRYVEAGQCPLCRMRLVERAPTR